ncbi:MAG: AMP-binding protein, partial [Cytophagales bacterium]|nr:AMP-binding protein [Cytophagales bacterium]
MLVTDERNLGALLTTARGLNLHFGCIIVLGSQGQISMGREDGTLVPATAGPEGNPDRVVGAEAGSYIVLTSGSTGEAKAVLGKCDSLFHYIKWVNAEFGFDTSHRVALISQITFDASIMDVWMAMTSGATICIPDFAARENIYKLIGWIEGGRISCIHCVPSVFRLITKHLKSLGEEKRHFRSLKYVMLAGEPLYNKDITSWRSVVAEAEVVNLYGTTETTINNTFHRIGAVAGNPAQTIHVGKPVDHSFILILNPRNKLCKIGEAGDVYIKSKYYTKGYYGNEALTRRQFVQNPLSDVPDLIYRTGDSGRYLADRNLEVLGRKDDQVKINGIRVELREIERAVMGQEGLREVALKVYKGSDLETVLICYYTSPEKIDPAVVRKRLSESLNENLIPPYIFQLDAFPLNINGKVDKKALPLPLELLKDEINYEPCQDPVEEKLESIWQEILHCSLIGRNTSFFRMGGQSLKAIQLISRVYKTFKADVSLADFFENPTIRQLAEFIRGAVKGQYETIVRIEEQDYYDVSDAQKRLWVLSQSAEGNTAYNIFKAYLLEGDIEVDAFEKAVAALFAQHESLRTHFVRVDNEPRQRVREKCNPKE